MKRRSLAGPGRRELRLGLGLFFLALAVPTAILVHEAYDQLEWEVFHRHRIQAEELASRIDRRLSALVETEAAKSFADYRFLVVAGEPAASFVQRSPLSAYPVVPSIPGLVGHFQVDAEGRFSTPLLPDDEADPAGLGIPPDEGRARAALARRIRDILARNRLLAGRGNRAAAAVPGADDEKLRGLGSAAPAEVEAVEEAEAKAEVPATAAFDRLEQSARAPGKRSQTRLGRVEDLDLAPYRERRSDKADRTSARPAAAPQAARKEKSVLAEASGLESREKKDTPARRVVRIRTFESEVDPFQVSLLESGHFVFYRKVWRVGERTIQGALVASRDLVDEVIAAAFRETSLSRTSNLAVAFDGDVLAAFGGEAAGRDPYRASELAGSLLHRSRLSAPLGGLELIFTATRLPLGPGGALVTWLGGILAVVLCGGVWLMYRLGTKQVDLALQQRDFVAAVSHELRTPLTSIRMYGEMLREGWASEEKRTVYYEYIHDESERLSRLIANVLQLARMSRNDLEVTLEPVTLDTLADGIRSKVSSPVERAGFRLETTVGEGEGDTTIRVDPDCFSQVVINLVDNALKFSARAENKVVEVGLARAADGNVKLTVRDHGPGVPRDQMKKIFRLFYRSESELTRETVGTGIGLALVQELALAMDARVEVANRDPGAEFSVSFPVVRSGARGKAA